jgi:hypothetical protein
LTWILSWTVVKWTCPVLLSLAPANLKPLLCKAELRPETYITTDPQGVQEKLEELGQGTPMKLEYVIFNEKSEMQRKDVRPKWRAYIEE